MVLTFDAVNDELGKIVEEFGREYHPAGPGSASSFDAGSCVYMDASGEPVCLIGHLIARLDPEMYEKLADENTTGIWGLTNQDVPYNPTGIMKTFVTVDSYPTHRLLSAAQSYQDEGKPWGESVDMARADVVAWKEREEGHH